MNGTNLHETAVRQMGCVEEEEERDKKKRRKSRRSSWRGETDTRVNVSTGRVWRGGGQQIPQTIGANRSFSDTQTCWGHF